MSRVLALVEGRTEQTFVSEVLAPALGIKGVFLSATLTGKPGHKGGVRRWASVRKEILTVLKRDPLGCCTTMFDYYALPADWPGRQQATTKPYAEAAGVIEDAVHAAISEKLGDACDPRRFVPYIQMHEFEALLFTEPSILADVVQCPARRSRFEQIVTECGAPEAIDDNPLTAPSKRIAAVAANYQKVLHGAIAAKRIGLARMREACPHFDDWVGRLEALAQREAA
jgi:hypothetical protein